MGMIVLGLDGQARARRLVRLLLADALGGEGAWEKQLENWDENDGRGLLIRFGESSSLISQNPLLATLAIPAPILKSNNLEILISTLAIQTHSSRAPNRPVEPLDLILSPSLKTAPLSTSGFSIVTYPVHKTLLVGEGLESSISYGRFTAAHTESKLQADLVKAAFEFPILEVNSSETAEPNIINTSIATRSLEKFRESVSNSTLFEHGWNHSGLLSVLHWLSAGTKQEDERLKPAVRNLIQSLLNGAEEQIKAAELAQSKSVEAHLQAREETSIPLKAALKKWAESAHTELRDQLDMAFTSPLWQRLAWWKLFWRADDVRRTASKLLEQYYLPAAEKEIIWLSGRLEQANVHLTPSARPWPRQIAVSRSSLITAKIPILQTVAQHLVLNTFLITSSSSALSALVYISTGPAIGVYESGLFGAAGLVWALKRLQTQWERARGSWVAEVEEVGRTCLRDMEDVMERALNGEAVPEVEGDRDVEEGGGRKRDDDEVEPKAEEENAKENEGKEEREDDGPVPEVSELAIAREAVESAKRALSAVK
ncbi:MAG: hypothetical protein M1829_005693 [Trizodia sp. TS-e1964]|nr:MAG: hypothetical protein M1829_005693 [Trizodia sp. TS-e1964]